MSELLSDPPQAEKKEEKNGTSDTNVHKHDVKSDKPSAEITITSANDWEHANLGDDARKEKFLKLMGAAKVEHKGKIVIGETDTTTKHKADDPDKLNEGLEEQFQHGLEHKLKSGFKGHLGLGFTKEETEEKKADADVAPPLAGGDTAKDVPEQSPDKAGEKRTLTEGSATDSTGGEAAVPKKKPMMMNFVKASDS